MRLTHPPAFLNSILSLCSTTLARSDTSKRDFQMDSTPDLTKKNIPDDLPSNSLLSYDPNRTVVESKVKKQSQSDNRLSSASRPSLSDIPPLKTEGDTYQLRKRIGKGGMGEVLEALQVNLNRIVAIKRLRQDVKDKVRKSNPGESEQLDICFRQEVIATANLDHPNVLPVYDLGQDEGGEPIMAMKLVRGTPWDEIIKKEFSTEDVEVFLSKHVNILIDVSQAVAFAHSRGIVHRDLKPAQVMLGEFGEVLLADWGLAIIYDIDALNKYDQDIPVNLMPTPENAGNPAGTPAFMAPEQTSETAENIGPWTDVYLLGGILFQILTGSPPYSGANAQKCFLRAMMGEISDPEILAPDRKKPPELLSIAIKALSPDPNDRHSSAKEFLETLQDCISGAEKRRKADQLIQEAEGTLDNNPDDYGVITRALTSIAQANGLWGEHPQLYDITCKAHHQMAGAALEKGDLSLAEVHAQNMPEGPEQKKMVELVKKKILAFKQREKQRHLALIGIRILLGIIIAGGGVFASWLYTEKAATQEALEEATLAKEEALVQKENALKATGETRDFVNFLLMDLGQQLAPLDQVAVFNQIGSKVVNFYNSIPPDQRSEETEFERAEALWSYALPLLIMGEFQNGVDHLMEAFDIVTTLTNQNPREDYFKTMVIYASLVTASYGLLHDHKQQEQFWTKLNLRSLNYLETSFPGSISPDDIKTLNDIVNNQEGLANSDEQREVMMQAIIYVSQWHEDDSEWQFRNAIMASWLGELFEHQGHQRLALKSYEKAIAIHLHRHSLGESQQRQLLKIIENRLEMARTYERSENVDQALGQTDKALEIITSMAQEDSTNLKVVRCHSQVLRFKSRCLAAKGEEKPAMSLAQQSVEMATRVAANDPHNAVYQYDLAISLQQLASLHIQGGDLDQASTLLSEIIVILKPLCEDPEENTFWVRLMNLTVSSANELADKLGQSGKTQEANNLRKQTLFWRNAPEKVSLETTLNAEFIAGTMR
jgi:serine/threonine protein kinase